MSDVGEGLKAFKSGEVEKLKDSFKLAMHAASKAGVALAYRTAALIVEAGVNVPLEAVVETLRAAAEETECEVKELEEQLKP